MSIISRWSPSSCCSFIILKNFSVTLGPSEENWINLDWSSVSTALLNLLTNWSGFAPCKNSEVNTESLHGFFFLVKTLLKGPFDQNAGLD